MPDTTPMQHRLTRTEALLRVGERSAQLALTLARLAEVIMRLAGGS